MPNSLRISNSIEIPAREISLSFSRASGAGGQNVNKVNSKVTLRWIPSGTVALRSDQIARFIERFSSRMNDAGEVVLSSSISRDQARNIEECLGKLAAMIRQILAAPKKRIATKPGRASKEKRLENKKRRSLKKHNRRKFDSD